MELVPASYLPSSPRLTIEARHESVSERARTGVRIAARRAVGL